MSTSAAFDKINIDIDEELTPIKCVMWDLDNTVWDGTLIEDDSVILKDNVVNIIKTLDNRGILQSISSKNNFDDAMEQLRKFKIDQYFIYPQINWNSKSSSIDIIREKVNIGMNTIAFIDDQTFELEEVNHSHKEVVCIDASELGNLLEMPIMSPRFITNESKMRRHMYQSDIERNHAEEEYKGANDTFLETLEMEFSISNASEDDLQRAEELTERTNQLNSTGYTYSYDELNNFRISEKHKLLTSKLNDKYGTYGTIGLALVECTDDAWVVKLLLMSCRVMSRGVGTIMMNHIMNEAKNNNARLLAEFVQTDRNRLMYITYKFAGFKEIVQKDNIIVFEGDLSRIQPNPEYVKISIDAS